MQKILIFGDSVAAGRNVRKTDSWPLLLADHLDKEDSGFFLLYNLSVAGDATFDLLLRFLPEVEARCKNASPDETLIIFAIGLNDSKSFMIGEDKGKAMVDFATNIKNLINQGRQFSSRLCFVGFNPVVEEKMHYNSIPLANEGIAAYNEALKFICEKVEIPFVDIFTSWITYDYGRLLAGDGMHPNKAGHQQIFINLLKVVVIGKYPYNK